MARWAAQGATPIARPLRYPPGWKLGSSERPIEKGIDVKLAIDAVMMALRGEYDVAVIASCDTDLVPVLEALLSLGRDAVLEEKLIETEVEPDWSVRETLAIQQLTEQTRAVQVEVIGWAGYSSRLSVKGEDVVARFIGQLDFRPMRDDAKYD